MIDAVLHDGNARRWRAQPRQPWRGGRGLMRLGTEQHPIDRAGLRGIGQVAQRQFDCAFRPLQRQARDRLARAGEDFMPARGGESAGNSTADAAQPDDRNSHLPRSAPRGNPAAHVRLFIEAIRESQTPPQPPAK
jgi:hypothetical protein